MFGRYRRDGALFQGFLHLSEVLEQATHHQLGAAVFAGAFAHLVQSVVHQVKLQIILIQTLRLQTEYAHFLELEGHAAAGGEVAAILGKHIAHAGHGARRVVSGGLDQHGDAVRRIAFIDDLDVIGRIAPGGALDRRLDLVLGHVDGAGVLDDAPQGRVGRGVGAAGFNGNGDVFADTRELLGHAVPTREHRVLANFKYATHGVLSGS